MTISENPWEWPEEVWRAKVDRVRAGDSLKPATWPGGAKCAVAMSFDVDHDSNELRDGGTSIGALSRGQYGHRQGIPHGELVLLGQGLQLLRREAAHHHREPRRRRLNGRRRRQ